MPVGKEIKVSLSLDDSGFSVKVKGAGQAARDLQRTLGGLAGQTDKTEAAVGELASSFKGFTENFGAMQKQLAASVETLTGVVTRSFTDMSARTRASTKEAEDSATRQINARERVLRNEIDTNRKLMESRTKMYADLKRAENDAVNRALAAKNAIDARRDSYMKAPIGSPGASYSSYAADTEALQKEVALHERNAAVIGQEAAKASQLIAVMREEQAVRNAGLGALQKEREMASVTAAIAKSNAAEVARVKQIAAARAAQAARDEQKGAEDAARLAKQLSNEQVAGKRAEEAEKTRIAREAAAERARIARMEAEQQRREMKAVADMWKGMAAMYSGAKISGGLIAGIKEADDYERVMERMRAMNIDGAQGQRNTLAMAKRVQDENPNISKTEALKVTLATTAGAVTTDPAIVGRVVPEIAKFTTVMTRLFPEQAHNIEQFTQNMMGVMEARGIAKDPDKMIAALDNLARALILTQGKISVQDYETLSRRGGAGNALFKNDESILYDVAAASQLKSMGGGGGGGAGGVSSYATMMRQASKRAQGGVMEKKSALENLVEFGVIDKDELMAANGNKPITRNGKTVPYVGAEKAADNMTLFAMEFAEKIKAKLAKLPESDTRFFAKGADRKDDLVQAKAYGRWLDQSIGNTSANEFYKMFATHGAQERIQAEVGAAKNAESYGETQKKAMESWGLATDKMVTSVKNLGNTIGTALIPVLQPVVEWVTKLTADFGKFLEESNNGLAALTGITAGFNGVMLSVRGFASMFGALGLTKLIKELIGVGGGLGSALKIPFVSLESWANFKILVSNFGTAIGSVMSKIPGVASVMGLLTKHLGAGSLAFRALGMSVKNLGSVMIAFDIGYMIGTWLSTVKVAGVTIGDHVTNMFTRIEVALKRLMMGTEGTMLKVRNFLHIDSDDETKKATADLEARKKALDEYAKFMIVTEEDVNKREAAATAKAAADREKAAAKARMEKEKNKKNGALGDSGQDESEADTGTVNTKGLFKDTERPDRDPLGAALAAAEGKVNEQKEKLGAIIAGAETLDSLRRQAAARIEGKRMADDYSVLHLAKNRPAADDARITQLKEATYQELLLTEQTKALDFAKQRVAASTQEADAAMQRVADAGAPKETDAFRALNRELERAEVRLGAGAQSFDRWAAAKARALFEQSRADAGNYTADLHQSNDKSKIDLQDTDRERIEAELAVTRNLEEQKYKVRSDTLAKSAKDARDAAIKEAYAYGPPTKAALEEVTKIDRENQEARDALDAEYAERRRLRILEEGRARETAMQKQAREWKDVGKQMDDVGARAGENFVGMLTSSLGTGRIEFGKFVKDVLADIANVQLKSAIADPMNAIIQQGTDWIKENLFGMTKDMSAATAATAKAAADTNAAAASTTMAGVIYGEVIPALHMMTAKASGGSVGSLFGGSTFDYAGAAGAAEASTSTGSIAEFMFANGGIMTSMGPMQLRKYANGGVANSPQVAVYGEAGPEAYVPLPDGRTIPVTMNVKGAGQQQAQAPAVQVNVINQTSSSVNASQGQPRFDGKQMILDVVLTAASQPGTFRSGMKEAMK
jgi:hypothetical protein